MYHSCLDSGHPYGDENGQYYQMKIVLMVEEGIGQGLRASSLDPRQLWVDSRASFCFSFLWQQEAKEMRDERKGLWMLWKEGLMDR